MQRVTPDTRYDFGPSDEDLKDTFMTYLFQGVGEGTIEWGFTHLQVKHAGMAPPDPTKKDP